MIFLLLGVARFGFGVVVSGAFLGAAGMATDSVPVAEAGVAVALAGFALLVLVGALAKVLERCE